MRIPPPHRRDNLSDCRAVDPVFFHHALHLGQTGETGFEERGETIAAGPQRVELPQHDPVAAESLKDEFHIPAFEFFRIRNIA